MTVPVSVAFSLLRFVEVLGSCIERICNQSQNDL